MLNQGNLIGASEVYVEYQGEYDELGAIAMFDYGIFDMTVNSAVNVNALGTYTVTYNVSDANGNAAAEVTRTVIIESNLSIAENTNYKLKVYPNPVKDKLFISGNKTPISISIFNVLGKEVISIKNTNNINVQALPSGVYTIRISDGVEQANRKFIKN